MYYFLGIPQLYCLGDEPQPPPQTVLNLEFGDFTTTSLPQWPCRHTIDMKRGTLKKQQDNFWTLVN